MPLFSFQNRMTETFRRRMAFAIASGAVLLSACATTPMPRSRPAFMFGGRTDDLTQLVAAANACGLTSVGLTLEGANAPFVLIDIPGRSDARFDCTMRWIGEHPEMNFFRS